MRVSIISQNNFRPLFDWITSYLQQHSNTKSLFSLKYDSSFSGEISYKLFLKNPKKLARFLLVDLSSGFLSLQFSIIYFYLFLTLFILTKYNLRFLFVEYFNELLILVKLSTLHF